MADDQYNDISEMIYDTDPYIYPALFGEEETGKSNAKTILPDVFQGLSDTLFSKQNLYVAKVGNEIAGLILWHKGGFDWDNSGVLNCAAKKHIVRHK